MTDTVDMETAWERIKEAFRLAVESGHAEVTFELRDAESLVVMAESRE